MPLSKTYSAAEAEPRIRAGWEAADCFRAGAGAGAGADPYCIVIPPPNVTGALHMGHALNATLQDILVRWRRMQGFDVLWQPGVDHAGIATQMVVERQLAADGEPGRRALGRDRFLDKVWQWKEASGSRIGEQFRRIGASCDWSRERFTMDEGLSRAVREVFVRWFREGLIFRDKRLVNWDPKFETAISDLEVRQVETVGRLWRFRYPFADGGGGVEVATTRPETMLGDTGVAVHPDDPRHAAAVGRTLALPLVGRRIPVVADEHADPEAGTGAVKITPAHDFNDFAVGRRAGLAAVRVFDDRARLDLRGNAAFRAGLDESEELARTLGWHGLDRFDARERVVARMKELGLLVAVEEHRHVVPHGDRSGLPVEPHLTDQWFVDAAKLAPAAIEAVRSGRTVFHPRSWETTYFRWLENIEPWCISRQLWWGHRIPVWYGPDGRAFAAMDEGGAAAAARAQYGEEVALRQDEDVLDTWFSSALWPFSTLGWPEDTPELARYYPTAVLVTAFDIIFFWVARMMMAGLHFCRDADGRPAVPFRDVYVHAIVRDEHGQKMSKSLGNVLDPVDLTDRFGTDAVRFTLASMATLGRDIRLSERRVEGNRNFVTKLWNAARFVEGRAGVGARPPLDASQVRHPVNCWMLERLDRLVAEVDEFLGQYRFDEAARSLYAVVWGLYCDWYLEFCKDLLVHPDGSVQDETRTCLIRSFDRLLTLLHPFLPYVTEEIWQRAGWREGAGGPLVLVPWPRPGPAFVAPEAAREETESLIAVIEALRKMRSELGVPPSAQAELVLAGEADALARQLQGYLPTLSRMGRVAALRRADEPPAGAAVEVLRGAMLCLPLGGLIDVLRERERLSRRERELAAELARVRSRLENRGFLERAPAAAVEAARERAAEAARELEKIGAIRRRLMSLGTEDSS